MLSFLRFKHVIQISGIQNITPKIVLITSDELKVNQNIIFLGCF